MLFVRMGRSGGLGCLLFSVLFLLALFFILKGLFALLFWASPVLIGLAVLINWRAVSDTGRDLLEQMKRNPAGVLVLGALAFFGLWGSGVALIDSLGMGVIKIGVPLLSLYILFRAMGYSRLAQFQQTMGRPSAPPEEEFVEFEELESRPKESPPLPEEPLNPPDPPEQVHKPGNSYDEFFK